MCASKARYVSHVQAPLGPRHPKKSSTFSNFFMEFEVNKYINFRASDVNNGML